MPQLPAVPVVSFLHCQAPKNRTSTQTPFGIYGFFGDYRFLSNFEVSPLRLEGAHTDGLVYPSAEHAYMALKTRDLSVRARIAALPTPREARNIGQTINIRQDWETYKPHAMLVCLRAKFGQNKGVQSLLLETGTLYLEETNDWGDRYWGVVEGAGLNMLGKTLMQVRQEQQKLLVLLTSGKA